MDLPQIKVHIEPVIPLAVLEFQGDTTSDIYKKGIKVLLDQTKRNKIFHWLIKCDKGCSITTEDQYWTMEEVVPIIVRDLKLHKIAIVEPTNIYNRIDLISLFEKLSSITPIEIQFFEKELNARKWLDEDCHLNF